MFYQWISALIQQGKSLDQNLTMKAVLQDFKSIWLFSGGGERTKCLLDCINVTLMGNSNTNIIQACKDFYWHTFPRQCDNSLKSALCLRDNSCRTVNQHIWCNEVSPPIPSDLTLLPKQQEIKDNTPKQKSLASALWNNQRQLYWWIICCLCVFLT